MVKKAIPYNNSCIEKHKKLRLLKRETASKRVPYFTYLSNCREESKQKGKNSDLEMILSKSPSQQMSESPSKKEGSEYRGRLKEIENHNHKEEIKKLSKDKEKANITNRRKLLKKEEENAGNGANAGNGEDKMTRFPSLYSRDNNMNVLRLKEQNPAYSLSIDANASYKKSLIAGNTGNSRNASHLHHRSERNQNNPPQSFGEGLTAIQEGLDSYSHESSYYTSRQRDISVKKSPLPPPKNTQLNDFSRNVRIMNFNKNKHLQNNDNSISSPFRQPRHLQSQKQNKKIQQLMVYFSFFFSVIYSF